MAGKKDIEIVRELAKQYAEIAAKPEMKEKASLWNKKNKLEHCRPLIFINEIPWHEMNVDDELTCGCADNGMLALEQNLRMSIYSYKHFPVDMVYRPEMTASLAFADTGYGLQWGEGSTHSKAAHGANQYNSCINTLDDVAKITDPVITPNKEQTEKNYQWMKEVFDNILPVIKQGICHQWCAAWDYLVTLYGIEKLYVDMTDNPELVHAAVGRFMEATNRRLDQLEKHGLLSAGYNAHRVGSGGLGITDQLPTPENAPTHVTPKHQWGTCTGQIFSEVSPSMHEEFCLQYERPYLERFGLSCYGCCEPLHNKIEMLSSVKNLRRVSMSPWINIEKAVANMGTKYIFSFKPNPAHLAGEKWNGQLVRDCLRDVLERTKGCHVELILKDISTVRNEPKRLWAWAEIASEVAEEFATKNS